MGFQILDGKGRGFLAEVNSSNQVNVRAISFSQQHDINKETGKVWSIPFEGLNPDSGEVFVVYIQNTGDADLELVTYRVSSDTAATQVHGHKVSGTAVGGATITPVSRNLGSGALPSAIIESGTDITGLTKVGTLMFMQLAVVNTTYIEDLGSTFILPKGTAVGITVETATANITGVLTLVEATGN